MVTSRSVNTSRRRYPMQDPIRALLEQPPTRDGRSWYAMAKADPAMANRGGTSGGRAVIDVYGEIGMYGVEASYFVAELRQLDVAEIELHLASVGGDVFEGLAIYQALIDHPASVHVQVDSVAASIAAIIAQAGDRITIGANAEMMIHDAWGMCVGNAADMNHMAALLDRASDNLAGLLADRAGGTVKAWRKAMQADMDGTWYNATEAVEAGLADEISKAGRRGDDDPAALWANSVVAKSLHTSNTAPDLPGTNLSPSAGEPDGDDGAPEPGSLGEDEGTGGDAVAPGSLDAVAVNDDADGIETDADDGDFASLVAAADFTVEGLRRTFASAALDTFDLDPDVMLEAIESSAMPFAQFAEEMDDDETILDGAVLAGALDQASRSIDADDTSALTSDHHPEASNQISVLDRVASTMKERLNEL